MLQWSLPLLWQQFEKAYNGDELSSQSFNHFIRHLTQVEGGDEFWRSQTSNLNAAAFPALPHVDYSPDPNQSITHSINGLSGSKSGYTISTMIQLSWAIVLSHYTDSEDVVFGLTSNGRGAALEGIAEITGPTIATVPMRVALNGERTVNNSLSTLQQQTIDMIPFLQYGLHNIRRISADAAKACDFQSQLVIQPSDITTELDLGGLARAEAEDLEGYEGFASYAFVMFCHMQEGSNDLQISVNYDSHVLQEAEARRMVEQFHAVLRQLSTKQNEAIREIDVISKEDMTQLSKWNGSLPAAAEETLHDLVLRNSRKQPTAEAVCAWDGNLTYRELDYWSSRLAGYLLSLGVHTESKVAVCLEKSCWSIVTLLAVLRAGCACVLIDHGHPRRRIEEIIKRTEPHLIVASEAHVSLVDGLTSELVPISLPFIQDLPPLKANLPTVTPTQAAVILFTSGSTGTPKGIVMEHVNLSTSILAHAPGMNVRPDSRSLHFASYAFDVSIYEIFNTLVFGGCVCVPSEYDRMNNLAAVIRDQRINWALLTPSTLSLFRPEDVPSLKTLVLAGEAVTRDPVAKWADKVSLINAYGPAEGTFCTVGPILPTGWRPGTIGHMVGSVGWIVDVSSSTKLAAIGAIGELVIEGPIVTRGYLNELEKTAAAFIDSPSWLRSFRSKGTEGRLYKTGDLVQYNPDGTIRYVGRKDGQVKLRGQRIELGEVEYHVGNCFPSAADVIADVIVPRSEGRAPFLVACIAMGTDESDTNEEMDLFLEPTKSFRGMAQNASNELLASIPPYMVPELLLPLRHLPLTRSGKVDRRQLREACSLLSIDRIRTFSAEAKTVKRAPSTSTERTLQQIWARVLNTDVGSIGIDDNFFRLGGDSINAMQVVAQCAAAGLKTSVAALFQGKTIAQMSLRTEQMHSRAALAAEKLNVQFDLSPIQQMFFDTAGRDFNHFNQSLSFRLSPSASREAIKKAMRWIVANHSMLRARFIQAPEGRWGQMITGDAAHSYLYREHKVFTLDEAASSIQSDQQQLDIKKGPLFICHIIEVDQDGQLYLSLTAHHLIIDIVSWQIILSDVELLLADQRPPAPPLSFQTWSGLQATYATNKLQPFQELPEYTPKEISNYWGISPQENCWGDAVEHKFTLGERETQILLGSANNAFGTQPVEILHAALLQAFAQTFTDRPAPAIFSEGHGREPWDPSIDPTRTVGWFTTMWPANVSVQPGDSLLEIVRKTKDARRQLKSNGWADFTSSYLHPEGVNRSQPDGPLEILFNYSPGFGKDPKLALQPFSFMEGELSQMSPKMSRFALVDVLAEVQDSELSFNFIYNRNMRHHQTSISHWIENTKHCLEIASSILTQQETIFTASDFPLLAYSYPELDGFNKNIVATLKASSLEVEDAYPCSPIQEGMILSQAKVAGQYVNRWFWSIKAGKGSSVHPEQLKDAWQQVLQKHPLLRTVLYESPRKNGHHDQVVLKKPPQGLCLILPRSNAPLQRLQAHQFDVTDLSPPHRLAICASPTGDVACLLEINHTIVDGISRQLILRDLRLAYDNKLAMTLKQAYRDYVEHLESLPLEEAITYWEKYLGSVEQCILPPSPPRQLSDSDRDAKQALNFTLSFGKELRDFCAQHELTLANTFQLAWALVLRLYLNSDSACFGYMTSGRDVPIPDIDDTVGPFINLLICRIGLGEDVPVLDLLQQNQAEFVQSLVHQHLSMADKMKAAKSSETALFNTVMSVQKEIDDSQDDSSLLFKDFTGDDPTEVSK